MNRVTSLFHAMWKFWGVGAWVLLVLMMALAPSEIPAGIAIGVLVLVSSSSAVSMLIVFENVPEEKFGSYWRRFRLLGVSLGISLGWAMLFGHRSFASMIPIYALIAVAPPVTAFLATLGHTTSVRGKSYSLREHRKSTHDVVIAQVDGNVVSSEFDIPSSSNKFKVCSTKHSNLDRNCLEPISGPIQESEADEEILELHSQPSPDVMQWLTRSMTANGEVIEGGVRIDFAEGQRDAVVHVSFCPPFQNVPKIVAEDLEGGDLEIRISAVFLFGARLSVRRTSSSKTCRAPIPARSHRIGFVAIAAPTQRAA